jgi:hypothetical protein
VPTPGISPQSWCRQVWTLVNLAYSTGVDHQTAHERFAADAIVCARKIKTRLEHISIGPPQALHLLGPPPGFCPIEWVHKVLILVHLPHITGVGHPMARLRFTADAIEFAREIKIGLGEYAPQWRTMMDSPHHAPSPAWTIESTSPSGQLPDQSQQEQSPPVFEYQPLAAIAVQGEEPIGQQIPNGTTTVARPAASSTLDDDDEDASDITDPRRARTQRMSSMRIEAAYETTADPSSLSLELVKKRSVCHSSLKPLDDNSLSAIPTAAAMNIGKMAFRTAEQSDTTSQQAVNILEQADRTTATLATKSHPDGPDMEDDRKMPATTKK